MRILLVTPVVPQRDGNWAIPVVLYAQLLGLIERHDVTLVTAVGDEPGEAEAAAVLAREHPDLDLHVVDRSRPRAGPRRWRRQARMAAGWIRSGRPWRTVWYADPGFQAVLDQLAATRAFDVAAVEDNALSVFRLPEGVPAVFTHNEVLRPRPVDWRPGAPRHWPRWAFGELDWRRWPGFQRAAWQRFDRVQVFSGRDAETIGELAPEIAARVRVNPFGLVVPAPADPAREMPSMVLFFGNFAHPPNRDAALWLAGEIMPAVRRLHSGARLRIVGTAPTAEVRDLAGPQVEVIADAESVEPHLEAAAVVLAPVRTGGGMRMKVLQALACGKAVVTTRRGAEGYDRFEAEPPLVVADEAPEIAAATAALLEDGSRRRELGRSARAFAQRHYSPQAWAERLELVYEEAREARVEVVRG
jgi:glycosyltransferase involved in cell wall biosynthesis